MPYLKEVKWWIGVGIFAVAVQLAFWTYSRHLPLPAFIVIEGAILVGLARLTWLSVEDRCFEYVDVTPQTDEKYRAEIVEYRKGLAESGPKAGEAFDRTIYTLGGAALAFVATYIKDLRAEAFPHRVLIGASIALLVASMVAIAIAQYSQQEYIHVQSQETRRILYGGRKRQRRTSSNAVATIGTAGRVYLGTIKWMNMLALILLLSGIALFMLASYKVGIEAPPKKPPASSGDKSK